MPNTTPTRIILAVLAGLALGFPAARAFRPTSTPPAVPPSQPAPTRPDRPWLRAWIAEQASSRTGSSMPEPPRHLLPDHSETQVARLAHKSIPAAITAIENITSDENERRRLVENLVLDPLLRADPVAALEIARTWVDYGRPVQPGHSVLFYDVPPAKYPGLVAALLAEPPGPFRSNELPQLVALWAARDPATAANWLATNLPPDGPDTPALNAIATAALVRPGEIPADLSSALAGAPPALRKKLYTGLLDAALDAPDTAAHASALVAVIPHDELKSPATALASQWAHLDPAAAAAWALTLPTTDARDAALGTVASGWPQIDPTAAATWLGALTPLQSTIATPIFARHLEPSNAIPE